MLIKDYLTICLALYFAWLMWLCLRHDRLVRRNRAYRRRRETAQARVAVAEYERRKACLEFEQAQTRLREAVEARRNTAARREQRQATMTMALRGSCLCLNCMMKRRAHAPMN